MGLDYYINIVSILFIAMTNIIITKLGFLYSAWIITLALLVNTILLNIYLGRFPNLKFFRLRTQIKRIISRFPHLPIKRVLLYNSQPLHEFEIPSFYSVVFELSEPSSKTQEQYEEFGRSLGWLWTTSNVKEFDIIGISESFADVYKNRPQRDDYMKEWRFHSRILGKQKDTEAIKDMKVLTNEPHWILYKKHITNKDRL